MVKTYGSAALENASPVELVVALYDGLIRFLGEAADSAQRGDVRARREAARRSLDIIIHLQATLRPDVGGKPAVALAEFYASIFALILRASLAAAPGEFHHAIRCVRTVREAWRQVALDPAVVQGLPANLQTRDERLQLTARLPSANKPPAAAMPPPVNDAGRDVEAPTSSWTA